ncbi:MAG: TIM barrel protein [bacterium]|nr:TIM barrel protein [bacterium]
MTRTYSLGYLTVGGLEPSAQIYVAAAAGYDHVGIRPIPMGLPGEPKLDIAHEPRLLENCRIALADTGITVNDLELARVMDGVDYEDYRPALEVGASLGAKVVITSVWNTERERQVEGLATVARLAADYGLSVVAEMVALSPVRSLTEMRHLVEQAGAPNLGLLVDVYHWFRSGDTAEDVASLPPGWLPMIHLCDLPVEKPESMEELREEVREHRLYVGEGDAPISELVAALPEDTVMAIEQPHLERLTTLGPVEYAARALRAAKKALEPLAVH